MHEIEQLMLWRRDKGTKEFIHLCRYQSAGDEGGDEWQGKIRAIKVQISQLQKDISGFDKRQTESIRKVERKIDSKSLNQEQALSAIKLKLSKID